MDIELETVCNLIHLARELVDQVEDEDRDEDDEDEDEGGAADSSDTAELKEYIQNLSDDERFEVIAIAWIGRGTFTAEDWDEAVDTARDEHPKKATKYLMSQPLLADELEEGLSELGLSCDDVET